MLTTSAAICERIKEKLTCKTFLLRFDTLSLDCNDHLFVYDGGHAAGQPKVREKFATSSRIKAD
jgi:hypothetical protein